MTWHVEFSPQAERDLGRLDALTTQRVLAALRRLAATGAGDVKRLQGQSLLRLRVGEWRVLFNRRPAESLIWVVRVLPRGRAYRSL